METCPNCGYCKHCGRGGHQVYPMYPSPWWQVPSYPTWIGTGGFVPTVTTGIGVGNTTGHTITWNANTPNISYTKSTS